MIYAKAKQLLTVYRCVCWSTVGRADAVHEGLFKEVPYPLLEKDGLYKQLY